MADKYDHKRLPSHFVGLNTIDVAPKSAVRDFVEQKGGHTVITSVCYCLCCTTDAPGYCVV